MMNIIILLARAVPPPPLAVPQSCDSLDGLDLPSFVAHATETPDSGFERGMMAIFYNVLDTPLERYWDDRRGTGGMYQGVLPAHGTESVGTYAGDTFFFRSIVPNGGGRGSGAEVARFTVAHGRTNYIVHCDDARALASPQYAALMARQVWMSEYEGRAGRPWIAHYGAKGPRPPPRHHIWPADRVGAVHTVVSPHGYWRGDVAAEAARRIGDATGEISAWDRAKAALGLVLGAAAPPTEPPTRDATATMNLTVLANSPRVLHVSSLLSEEECDLIMHLGGAGLHQSTLGGDSSDAFSDETRTSRQSWLPRDTHRILNDIIFPRFADALGIDDSQLQHRGPEACAEEFQVVHYREGQEYRNHVDFFDTGKPNSRFLTLLVYLNEDKRNTSASSAAAGGTSFPKAYAGRGLHVRPPKGDAVLFYSLLPDGNGDAFSEHAGLPVPPGQEEKWVANLWVWDPLR